LEREVAEHTTRHEAALRAAKESADEVDAAMSKLSLARRLLGALCSLQKLYIILVNFMCVRCDAWCSCAV
jgi:hypothetical protein